MSFNRTMYDPKASLVNHKQNISPGNYKLYIGQSEHSKQCSTNNDLINGVTQLKKGDYGERVKIEGNLQSRNIPLNQANLQNTIWDKNNILKKSKPCEFRDHRDIAHSCGILQNSLLSNPRDMYTEMSTLKNHITPYLHVDKQRAMVQDKKTFYPSTKYQEKSQMLFRIPTNTGSTFLQRPILRL